METHDRLCIFECCARLVETLARARVLSIDFILGVSCLFIQFVTITQSLFNTLQSHVSPMLIILFHLLFLFIRIIRVFDVIFHTFNCRLLEFIKIRTLNLTGNELLGKGAILIAIKIGTYVFGSKPLCAMLSFEC